MAVQLSLSINTGLGFAIFNGFLTAPYSFNRLTKKIVRPLLLLKNNV
jgi:hypothetical protein